MAPKALNSLRLALAMFSSLRESSSRAKAAHTILEKIHDSAIAMFNQAQGRGQGSREKSDSRLALTDDLEMWAGYTTVRVSKGDGKSPKIHVSPASSASPQPATGDDGGDGNPNYGLHSQAPSEVSATYGGGPRTSTFGASGRDLEYKRLTPQSGHYRDPPATPVNPVYASQEPYQLGDPLQNHPTDGAYAFQWEGPPQTMPATTTYAMSDAQWLAYIQTGDSFDLDTDVNLNSHTSYQGQ